MHMHLSAFMLHGQAASSNTSEHVMVQAADEEAPEVEVQIDDDPDLSTPPCVKSKIKSAFQPAQPATAATARTPAFAKRFEGEQEPSGFAWKVIQLGQVDAIEVSNALHHCQCTRIQQWLLPHHITINKPAALSAYSIDSGHKG